MAVEGIPLSLFEYKLYFSHSDQLRLHPFQYDENDTLFRAEGE